MASIPMQTVLGLMSGTSLDGVDAAVLVTDGTTIESFGGHHFRPYSNGERDLLRRALAEARRLESRDQRPGVLAEAEAVVTAAHAEAVEALRAASGGEIGLVGFHGQTVLHAPDRRITVQIGDGAALARHLGLPVVWDFRAADVAAGGEGAPLVPVFHRAIAERSGLERPLAIVNIGGVANATLIAADGNLVAFDTGPGNAPLDDFMRRRTGAAMDRDGAAASAGRVDEAVLARLLADPWFARPPPKSLDRASFTGEAAAGLAVEDGAATLTAYTARTIARGIALAGGAGRVVVVGGGARNPTMLAMLAEAAGVPIVTGAALGWSGDFVEAQAFAFLAARSLAGLPLSFPGTTGVPAPLSGGRLAKPD
jgi:anhydro-N-acetylmuramic acid kinase